MLVKCYECGREISDMAKTCPHCGAPMRRIDGAELGKKMSQAVHASILPRIKKLFLFILPILILGASISIIAIIADTYPNIKLCWANSLIICTHCWIGGIAFLVAVKKTWGLKPFKWLGWIDFTISYIATAALMPSIVANILSLEAFIPILAFGLIPLYLMYKFVGESRESKSSALGWFLAVLTIILSIFMIIGANQAASDRLLMRNYRSGAKLSPRDQDRACELMLKDLCR